MRHKEPRNLCLHSSSPAAASEAKWHLRNPALPLPGHTLTLPPLPDFNMAGEAAPAQLLTRARAGRSGSLTKDGCPELPPHSSLARLTAPGILSATPSVWRSACACASSHAQPLARRFRRARGLVGESSRASCPRRC